MKKFAKYSDEELMTLMSVGKKESEQAFSEIYARYSQKIYAYCLRMLESEEDAYDVFQDTFIKFFETYKGNSGLLNITGMLIRISRNLCLNYKRNRKSEIEFDELLMPVTDNSFEDKELVELIGKALKQVDFELREIFILRLYEGLSYSEISELVGFNISTVKNRFFRAKDKLKQILQPYLEEM